MKHFAYNSSYDTELFAILLKPSWLSSFIGVISSLSLVVYTVATAQFSGSEVRLLFFHFQETQGHSSTALIGDALDKNTFISNLPLLFFWCLVGLIVYMFASSLVAAIQHAAQFNDELAHYAHLNRAVMIRIAIEKLAIRSVVLALWVPYIILFFHWITPYVVNLAFIASGELGTFTGIAYLVLATIVFTVSLYAHTVLLRLLVLRPRVFSGAIYMT